MAHIHYKFNCKLNYDRVQFYGPHITLKDLKRQIMSKEKLGAADCDLRITNAQTNEEYTDDEELIPKGSSVIIRRIPVIGPKTNSKSKTRNIQRPDVQFHHTFGAVKAMNDHSFPSSSATLLSKMTSLVDTDASEEDKIKAMMDQSIYPLNYNKTFGSVLPANYTCYRCGNSGHHIRNCPTSGNKNFEGPVRIKKSTGIPRSFMVEVDDPNIKGAMMTNCGHFAIPAIHAEAYAIDKKEKPPFVRQDQPVVAEKEEPIPANLLCLICEELLSDAVVIPCCGNSYCDDCIRTALLKSEEHTCPTCSQSNVSPDTLIANQVLRQAVNTFKNEQGQAKCSTAQVQNPTQSPVPAQPPLIMPSQKPPPSNHSQRDPLLYHAQAADIPPPSAPTQTTGTTSASSTLSPPESTNKEAEEKAPDGSAAAAPSVPVSCEDPAAAPSPLIPLVTHTVGVEQRQGAGANQQQPSSVPLLSGLPTSWDRSSSSSGCPTGGWNESQQLLSSSTSSSSSFISATPPPLFPPPLFHKFLAAPQPLNSYPPGYPPPTPVWPLPTPPHQGAPIPSLCPSTPAIPALIPKEWYRQERKKRERSPHRGSSSRPSSSRSNSKSSKSCRSYSRSSSRSRSRSRSRSQSRSRPHSPYSRHTDPRSRSHSSRSYSYGYKRSPTPSSSSSPRLSYSSRSKSPSDHGKNSHHSRHHSKKSASSGSSSSSRRRGDRSQREAESSGGSLAGYPYAQQANPAASSLQLDRERYLQWKRGYKEWCENYFNSYVGHFHQPPPPLLSVPVSPLSLWGDGGGSWNHSHANSESRSRLQGRRTARVDGRSPPSHSSSDSRSPPSQLSSDRRSTPSQSLSDTRSAPSQLSDSRSAPFQSSDSRSTPSQSSSDSRSSPSHSSNDSRSTPSHSSSDGRSTPSEDGAQPRCDEKRSCLPVTSTKSSDEAELQGRRGGGKQKKNSKNLSTFKHDQKSTTKHKEGGGEESPSPAGADSTRDCRKTKSKHNVGPNICEHGTQQQDKTTASEALEPDRPLVKPDKRLERDRERKSRERKHLDIEKGRRRDKYSDSRHDVERRHKEKSSKGVGRVETERSRNRGGSKASDSSSEKNRKRKGEDMERSSVKAESGKCLKTKITEVPETCEKDSLGPFERKKPKTEKMRERKSWPLTERDIWEGGIKVKPQKKISININLDGKRAEEKTETQESSFVESVLEKAKDETEQCGDGKEENLNRVIDVNEKDESSRDREGVYEEKPIDREPRSIWEKATFRDDKRERGEEDSGGMKEDREDKDLLHCAPKGVDEEDERGKEEREEGDNVEASIGRVVTNDEGSVRGGEEEERRVRSDGGGRETGESVAGARRERAEGELTEEGRKRRMGKEDEETTGAESRHGGLNHTEDDGGACVDRQGRTTVAETPEDYTQGRAGDKKDKLAFMQAPHSKWEKEESEEERQDEEKIKAQTDAVAAILPSSPAAVTAATPTDREAEGERERKRQRSVETKRGRDREREKSSTLSSSDRRVAPSSGHDRNSRTLAPDRDRERWMETERARDRERGRDSERQRDRPKESKRSKERTRDEEKGRERERGGVYSSSAFVQRKNPSSSSRSPSTSRDPERRDRQRGDKRSDRRPGRGSGSGAMSGATEVPDENTHKTRKDTSLEHRFKDKHQPQYSHSQDPPGTRAGSHQDPVPSESSGRSEPRESSPGRDLMQSRERNESKQNTEDRVIKNRDMGAERDGASRWRDTSDGVDRRTGWEGGGELEEGQRTRRSSSSSSGSSSSSSSGSSSTSQESASDDVRKEWKRKHKNEKRQPAPELPKEGEGKKHKHKKKKSREGEEDESGEETDNRREDEEDHDKIYSVLLF